MNPQQVRARVYEDHEELRSLLRLVESLADRAHRGEAEAVEGLRREGLALNRRLAEHLTLEDEHMVPVLRTRRGEEAAERLAAEHREQRLLFEYMVGRLRDTSRPTLLLIRELKTFVELLREDMTHEEKEILDAADLWTEA